MQGRSGSAFGSVTGISSCGLFPRWRAGSGLLATAEDFDDAHRAAAVRAWLPQGERDDLGAWRFILRWRLHPEQFPDPRDIGLAACSGQQAVMADAVESVGQHVDQEAADELVGGQPHDLLAIAVLDPVILPAEGDSL